MSCNPDLGMSCPDMPGWVWEVKNCSGRTHHLPHALLGILQVLGGEWKLHGSFKGCGGLLAEGVRQVQAGPWFGMNGVLGKRIFDAQEVCILQRPRNRFTG